MPNINFQIGFSFPACFTQLRNASLTIKLLSQTLNSWKANKIQGPDRQGSPVDPALSQRPVTPAPPEWSSYDAPINFTWVSPSPSLPRHILIRKSWNLSFNGQVIPEELCGMGWPKSRDQVQYPDYDTIDRVIQKYWHFVDHARKVQFFVDQHHDNSRPMTFILMKIPIGIILLPEALNLCLMIIFFIKGAILGGPGDWPPCVAKSWEDPPCIRLP